MRVYISGKIGEMRISRATRRRFEAAEKMLQVMYPADMIVNPAGEAFQEAMDVAFSVSGYVKVYGRILLYDLQWLERCGAIYMLEGWDRSPGAQAELAFAHATGKQVFWQSEVDARVFWDTYSKACSWESVWLPVGTGGHSDDDVERGDGEEGGRP